MKAYAIRVTHEVAKTRAKDGGTRNVPLILTFSSHPQVWLGDLPPAIAGDSGLEIRELSGRDAARAVDGPINALGADLRTLRVPAPPAAAITAPDGGRGARLEERLERIERLLEELEPAEVPKAAPAVSPAAREEDRPPDTPVDDLPRAELEALHLEVLGRRPHPNAGDGTIRQAIEKARPGRAPDTP